MARKLLHDPEVLQSCIDRIQRLTPQTLPQWGSMTPAQMLAHCAEIQEVTNGKELKGTPFLVKLFKRMIRNMVVNDKPYPRSSKTHPQYLQTTSKEFEKEKEHLLRVIQEYANAFQKGKTTVSHSLFGEMSAEESGWAMYKHLDHHLTQFGV